MDDDERRFAAVVADVQARTGALRTDAASPRELEVGYLSIIACCTHSEVAQRIGVSPYTVRAYLARLAGKLGLSVAEMRGLLVREFWTAVGREHG